MMMFGIANGPLALATYIFRNSLVFHDVDKMTSVYIHVLPLFLTYGLVLSTVTSNMNGVKPTILPPIPDQWVSYTIRTLCSLALVG